MPIYEYQARERERSCEQCAAGFEVFRNLADSPLTVCPRCGAPLRKLISAPSIGVSRGGLDDRAKNAGFHKLKRLGKGEYEKQY